MILAHQDRKDPNLVAYLSVWGSVGAAAIAAIAVLSLWPDAEQEPPTGAHAPARLAQEVARLGARVGATEQLERGTSQRLAGIEERVAMIEAQMRTGAMQPMRDVVSGSLASIGQHAPTAAAGVSVAPPRGAPPISLTPPSVRAAKPKTPSQGVRLAQGQSLEALRLTWSLLTDRHRALLGSLESRYAVADGRPGAAAPYHLIAGPLEPAAAERVCKELALHGIGCAPTAFAGSAL